MPDRRRASRLWLAVAPAMMVWGCSDLPTAPAAGPSDEEMAGLVQRDLEVWSPTGTAPLTGEVEFKGRVVPELNLSKYTMTWQVDGGAMTVMRNSTVGGRHKRSSVNVSAFTWRGAGPYRITFIATNLSGRELARTSVDIMVEQPAVPGGSPFAGAKLWVNPDSRAKRTADEWRATRPLDAAQMDRIAAQPEVTWFTGWEPDIRAAVAQKTTLITGAGALPVYVAYNIPVRDCNSYSAGGATSASAYRTWIRSFVAGLGSARAVVVLEPDALAGAGCLSEALRQERFGLIADAVAVIRAQGSHVYIDAGHPNWISASTMASRLNAANIAAADGFTINVSNFATSSSNVTYGTSLSALVGGKHFIVDSSRNGNGPTSDGQWCNPDGRALGVAPTALTGNALVDAYLWIKKPGESDGPCNGGPAAGAWWPEYALGLAQRTTPTMLAMGG